MQNKIKDIAIIGGGIFGATCAIILGKKYKITIFERHDDLLKEASWANQYRHHMGYHYPRDLETVRQIQKDKKDFEKLYGPTIVKNFISYYSVSRKDSYTSAGNFIKFCKKFHLPYKIGYPAPNLLNPSIVETCLKTPESIYDYEKLKSFVKNKIKKNKNIVLKINHTVIGAKIGKDGKKILEILRSGEKTKKEFDYVINATYINRNKFCRWLKFPAQLLKFNFKEVNVLKFPIKKNIGVTIMDGPFATYLATNTPGIFTFGNVPLSVHKSKSGHIPNEENWLKSAKTRWLKMQKRCLKWMPILKDAKYIKSMFVVLPVLQEKDETRGRPTEVAYHGYGCWSILSGKIISCVSAAKKILEEIER